MLNFIIDTSVFALPPKSSDTGIEADNLATLKKNILCLEKLQRKDSATVSYFNNVRSLLKNNNYPIKKLEIESRIEELRKSSPERCEDIGLDSIVFEKWHELIGSMFPIKNADGACYKSKSLGIFSNIPDQESEPGERYAFETTITGADIYPKLPPNIRKTFRKYCGYIADLNHKYDSTNVNFLVVGEKSSEKDKENMPVTLRADDGIILSHVSIVGIQKAQALCGAENKFKNLAAACEEGRKKFNSMLVFGKEIKKENIEKDLFPQAGPPSKIYRYLETLNQVSEIILNKNIDFCETSGFNLIEMLNAHGLLCSLDSDKYVEYKCQARKYENESGKKMFFNIHVKPSTYGNKTSGYDDEGGYTLASKETVRIYLAWDNGRQKMRLGWIGHHPPSCGNCPHTECRAKTMRLW
jgi:hypothetical protein